jgi:hypothetical protein
MNASDLAAPGEDHEPLGSCTIHNHVEQHRVPLVECKNLGVFAFLGR